MIDVPLHPKLWTYTDVDMALRTLLSMYRGTAPYSICTGVHIRRPSSRHQGDGAEIVAGQHTQELHQVRPHFHLFL